MEIKNLWKKLSGSMLLILLFTMSSFAQSIEGDWYGMLNADGINLRLAVHVTATEGGYSSTWDSLDQDAWGYPQPQPLSGFPISYSPMPVPGLSIRQS